MSINRRKLAWLAVSTATVLAVASVARAKCGGNRWPIELVSIQTESAGGEGLEDTLWSPQGELEVYLERDGVTGEGGRVFIYSSTRPPTYVEAHIVVLEVAE